MKLPLLLALVLLPAALHAQAPQYRRAAGDTLRYREVTRATSEITSPQGVFTLGSGHDARIAVAFARGDTARGWYEALTLRSEFPGGERAPATAPLLGKPFVLTMNARGDVQTLSVPDFPQEVSEASDLTHQFNDFFVRLPASALRPGLEWTDTTQRSTPTAAGRTVRTTRVGRFRVRGDTTVAGVRGVVVEARMNNRVETAGPSPTPGIELRTSQEGTEEGVFVFSPERGRFLARRRTGSLEGHIEFIGGPQPMKLPQKMKYESTVEILP